ncbi:extracellular matrix regulator RemB [Gemmiger formicilis]|uniref:extracellular matrix regulator RemB n=1 Tax=Gemmiger formicilis TaxID=745368 RepID=UPI003CCB7147
MYFHAGQDFVLNTRDVIGVFDLDTAGASRRTEEYFRHVESEGAVVDLCAPGTLPKSFLVTDFPDETIYISQLSPAALKKSGEAGILKYYARRPGMPGPQHKKVPPDKGQ